MGIGPLVRSMLGPWESTIARAYRSFFVNLGPLVDLCEDLHPTSVLEVGCGEGLLADLLAARLTECRLEGIDISPKTGRLSGFRERQNVSFRQCTAEAYLESGGKAALVIVCDVLHHVPLEARPEFLQVVSELVYPGGYLLLKDWAPSATPIHLLGYLSDRVITGDRVIYRSAKYYEGLLTSWKVIRRGTLPPYRNNFFLLLER